MLDLKKIVAALMATSALTYASLLVPGQVTAVCGNLGAPIYCSVLAYGFPLPFVAESRATSPIGSVSRDPLSLLIGEEDLLWGPLRLSSLFWLFAVIVCMVARRRLKRQGNSS